ncbi:hypothetical protein GQ457_06G012910 [Hibiscus cannabinus]
MTIVMRKRMTPFLLLRFLSSCISYLELYYFMLLFLQVSISTLSCRSAFIAGRKLPNGSIDDLTYQNGWKSVRGYKNKLLKLQKQQEQHQRAKIKFKSSFVLNLQILVTQSVIFILIHCLGCVSLIWEKLYHL